MSSNNARRETSREFVDRLWRNVLYPRRPAPGPPPGALVLGRDPVTRDPTWIGDEIDLGLFLLGGSGTGKSNDLRVIIFELLKRKILLNEGFAIVDPHGSLAAYALRLIALYPELAPQVYYLDLRQRRVLGMNPLRRGRKNPHFTAACVTEALIKAFGTAVTQERPLMTRVFNNLHEALIHTDLILPDARFFLERAEHSQLILASLLDKLPPTSPVRSFWVDLSRKSASTADMYGMGPMNRIDAICRPVPLKRMLSVPTIGLDCLELMNTGGILIADLSREGTGVTVDAQHAFAALLVQEFRQVFEERAPDRARGFTLVLDELGDYCPSDFARVWTAARKFKLRVVAACQNLEMLLGRDGDRTLLQSVLAVPNKIVHAGIPLADARILAEDMFLGQIDVDRVKFQPTTVTWDPVPTPVTLRNRSWGESTTETTARSDTRGVSSSTGRTVTDAESGPADGRDPTVRSRARSESEGSSSSSSESEGYSEASTRSWSASEQDAWVTFYRRRDQKGTPVYRSIEEQVHAYVQRIKLAPRGHAVLVRHGHAPVSFKARHMQDIECSAEDLENFLGDLYDKPIYLDPADMDRYIEEHERELLALAEPRIEASKAASRKRSKAPRNS